MMNRRSAQICFALLLCLALPASLLAQGSIKGRLIDSTTRKPLALATLSVFKKSDTTLVAYHLSDPAGNFRVPGIPLNTACYAVISFIGYQVLRKDIQLKDNTPVDLGSIALPASARTLDEALVTAERPPIRVFKDTIEFNAASFKTLPDALVEDLLRKLPGVDIDKDGNIMVNGKSVNRILVDGKRFFGDDPKMATRNLPANVIDRVQVTDDKEQIDRSTDGDMTQIGKVINLTLKKSVKKGWFGKVYAGGGTDERYQLGGIANIYRDTLQLSLLAFSNNINAGGFNIGDITSMSGLTRSGINSIGVRNNGGSQGVSINGINFGGGDAGESKITGAGFNLNHTPNKKFSLYTQYFFGYNDNILRTLNQNQQFINDTSITTLTNTSTNKEFFSHVLNIGFNYHSDNLMDISFRSSGNYSSTTSTAGSLLNTGNSKLGNINAGTSILGTDQFNGSYSHDLFITKKYKLHPGRVFNLSQNLQYQGDLQRYTTLSNNIYFYPADDTILFDQLRRTNTPTLSTNTALGFVNPLSTRWTLRLNANYSYLRNQYGVSIYDTDPATGHYDVFLPALSNGYHRVQNIANGNALLVYTFKKWSITPGVTLSSQQIDNTYDKTTRAVNFSLFNVLPSLAIAWQGYRLQYSETVTVPDMSYLSPVPDSTNPVYISYGNPDLHPGKRHNISLSYFGARPQNGLRENFSIQGTLTDNDIVLSRTVATDGVQSVIPVNVNNSFRLGLGGSLGKDFRNHHFIFTARLSPRLTLTDQRLIVNGNSGRSTILETGPGLSFGFNWNDKVEINPDYSYTINTAHYSISAFQSNHVITQQIQADVIIRAPGKLIWENKILYRYTDPVAAGQPRDNLLWNAALGYPVLPHNKALLKLSVNDLLNRNNNFMAYTSGNAIINQNTNVLKRYFLLTFTYNIQNFNAENKNKGGKQHLFEF